MEEIEDLAKEVINTTEKAMALEKLWEETSRLSGKKLIKKLISLHIG